MLSTLLPFLAACTVIAAVPGPSTALIIRQSVRGGRRAGFATVLGNETGVFLWGLAAAFGFTALLAASRIASDVMRFTGAAVLIWFGVQSLLAARRTGRCRRRGTGRAGRCYCRHRLRSRDRCGLRLCGRDGASVRAAHAPRNRRIDLRDDFNRPQREHGHRKPHCGGRPGARGAL